jgi:hypothetical protein
VTGRPRWVTHRQWSCSHRRQTPVRTHHVGTRMRIVKTVRHGPGRSSRLGVSTCSCSLPW